MTDYDGATFLSNDINGFALIYRIQDSFKEVGVKKVGLLNLLLK